LIQEHAYGFYREMLGTTAMRGCDLASDTWSGRQRVLQEENNNLAITFSEVEVDNIVKYEDEDCT
jgi:hypothetical protein